MCRLPSLRSGTVLLRLAVSSSLICLSLAVASASPPMNVDASNTSDRCGTCHRDIFKMWRGSAHADAASDPIFLAANRETIAREGPAVSRVCLGCHAPVTTWNSDWGLEKTITTEGVSCDVCHRIESVDLADGRPRIR